jgi:hypothetical protein
VVNRVQANVAPLKVQGSIWPRAAKGRNLRTPESGVAAAHDRNPPLAMFRRRIDQRSTPHQGGPLPSNFSL